MTMGRTALNGNGSPAPRGMEEKQKVKGLSSNALKVIACISMIIDHVTYCFVTTPPAEKVILDTEDIIWYIGRGLGRSAFIIFAFLLVEGYFYTINLKKYVIRLLICAVVSEACFDFMCDKLKKESFMDKQNVLFLFVLGLLMLYVLEFVRKTYYEVSQTKFYLFSGLICSFGFTAAYFTRVDYGIVGMALIFVFYYFRNGGRKLVAAVAIWSVACIFLNHQLEWAGLIALIPIVKYYNRTRGNGPKGFFYVFYPLHMLLLGVLNALL